MRRIIALVIVATSWNAIVFGLPATAGEVVGCPSGMPCIIHVYNERAKLIIEWNDEEERDHFNFRWSRSGRAEQQHEVSGGRGGQFTLTRFNPNIQYTFKVQGCTEPLIGRSTCTNWYVKRHLSCGAQWNPCR